MHAHRRRTFLGATVGLWLPAPSLRRPSRRQLVHAALWRQIKGTGLERFELLREADHWILTGTILTMDQDQQPVEARYEVACDAGWRTERVQVSVRDTAGERRLRLAVRRGRWWVNGHEVTIVRGCVDVDLGWSPSTNTLPIRRLGLPVGAGSGPLVMAWIRFPPLTIEPLPQAYEHTSERHYRYTSRGGAFAADIEVDDAGLVLDYEGVWQRVGPATDMSRSGGAVRPLTEALLAQGPLATTRRG